MLQDNFVISQVASFGSSRTERGHLRDDKIILEHYSLCL